MRWFELKDEIYVSRDFMQKIKIFLPDDYKPIEKVVYRHSDPTIQNFNSEKTLHSYLNKVAGNNNIQMNQGIYSNLSYEGEFYQNFNYQPQSYQNQNQLSHSYNNNFNTPIQHFNNINITEFSPLVILF